MITIEQLTGVIGSPAHASDGDKLGKVGQVYLDDQTGSPEWVTVQTGMFGTKETFVPVGDATISGQSLRLPYDKDKVKGAPSVEAEQGHLSESEEAELYRYYGIAYETGVPTTTDTGRTGTERSDVQGRTVGHDTSGPTTDDAMTRSEEQMHVGTERVAAGKVRLRKHIVTEQVSQTVPVRTESVRVEREPITDANVGSALDGPALSEEEHEVVLTDERPVVAKETVPVERVRLDKDVVVEQQTVSDSVRKEVIETDGVTDADLPRR